MNKTSLWIGGPILALVLAAPAQAQRADSAAFIIRLGLDTTAVERYVRTADRIEATAVSRSPRTVVRRLSIRLAPDGSVADFATGPATGEMREATVAAPGGIPLVGGFYLPWELGLIRAFETGTETTSITMLSGSNPMTIPFRKLSDDRFALTNQFDAAMQARVDRAGRLQYLETQGGGTTVERVGWLDIDAFAREFADRDAAGHGLGSLSPADTARATVGGASLSVIYGRPALRGRDLRALVPFGQLWRTGANNATELRTDRTLRIGDVSLPAGNYSLFTVPAAEGWTLIINRQTGQSGLAHDESHDVGRVMMDVRPLADFTDRFTIGVESTAAGGMLRFQWGGTEAVTTFRIEG